MTTMLGEIWDALKEEIDGPGPLTLAFIIPPIIVILGNLIGGALTVSDVTSYSVIVPTVAVFELFYLIFLGVHRWLHQWELNAVGVMFFVFFAEFFQLVLAAGATGNLHTFFGTNYTWVVGQIVIAIVAGFITGLLEWFVE